MPLAESVRRMAVRKLSTTFSLDAIVLPSESISPVTMRYANTSTMKYLKRITCHTEKNWYLHEPKEVIVDNKVEILYDQVLQTDLEVGANRPDLVIKDKYAKKTYVVDVSCPCDLNIHKAEATKIAKYRGLRGQLQKMWGYECVTLPIVVGGLGSITSCLKDYLTILPGCPSAIMCQKISALGSKKILMDVLSRKR